jgi:hypothetical protein
MVGCGQTLATWLPSTKPSPPSTRPSDEMGRRSSAFVLRTRGGRAVLPSSWIIVAFWIVAIVSGHHERTEPQRQLRQTRLKAVSIGWRQAIHRRAAGSTARETANIQCRTKRSSANADLQEKSTSGLEVDSLVVPRHADWRNRAPLRKRILGQQRAWPLRRRGFRRAALRIVRQVRQRDGISELSKLALTSPRQSVFLPYVSLHQLRTYPSLRGSCAAEPLIR